MKKKKVLILKVFLAIENNSKKIIQNATYNNDKKKNRSFINNANKNLDS